MDLENGGLNAGFEIWYSDVSSFFGRRARTVLSGTDERIAAWSSPSRPWSTWA